MPETIAISIQGGINAAVWNAAALSKPRGEESILSGFRAATRS
ncbi:MAG: hypothetical protein M0Z84_12320 [Gammaproteobacteria bacterium]|nr:hypothetical protein [Gammaproteobacteria bacterium]